MKSNNLKNIISEIVKNELILTEDFKTQRQKYISQGFEPQIVDKYLNDFRELKDKKYKEAADANLPNLKVPKGNDRFNIDKYNTFRELEQIVDFVAGQRRFGSANFEDIEVDGKPVFKNNDVEIYYADTPRACIQYKGNKPYGWCVARGDSSNMFYNYRLQQHEPAFYFVKRIAATNKEFSLWNVTKDVFNGSFNDKYHFFVIQVIKHADINNESTKNYIVTSAMNDGDNQMSWSDILKIAPELNGLQKIFESKPLTPEEREKIKQYRNGLSDEEFAKLPYKEKAYYIAVYVKMDHYLTDNQFAILPEDLKNNYVGLGVGLSDNQYELIKSNSKLLKRYTEITNRKGEEFNKSEYKGAFRFQSSEIKILLSNNEFIANLNLNGIVDLLYKSSHKDDVIKILLSNNEFIANLNIDGIYYLLKYSTNKNAVVNKLISNNEFISNLDLNGIGDLLYKSSHKDDVIKILLSNKEFIANLNIDGIYYLLIYSTNPIEVFRLLGQKGNDYIANLNNDGIGDLLRYSSNPIEVFRLLGQKGNDFIANLNKGGIGYLLRNSSNQDQIKQIISKYRPDINLNENKRYKLTEQQFSRLVVKLNENKTKNPCWDGYEMVGMKKKGNKDVPNCIPVDEGVGDKYAEKKFGIPSEDSEFELKYNEKKLSSNKNKKIYDNGIIQIIKNPDSLDNFDSGARAIIDLNGNLYVSNPTIEQSFHEYLALILADLKLIKYDPDWDIDLPNTFITIQRYYKTNKFYFGESNYQLTPDDDRYITNNVVSFYDAYPIFKSFMDRAKLINPQYEFISEKIDSI